MPTRRTVIIIAILVVAVTAALFTLRGNISKRIYYRQGREISSALKPVLAKKYGEEFIYTLDKFWSCYEGGIVSQNDLTDVMEKMKKLGSTGEISDHDIFDLIGYISRIYTDEMRRHHKETMETSEPVS